MCQARVSALVEHDSVPCDALPGQMGRLESGEFRLADRLATAAQLHAAGRQAVLSAPELPGVVPALAQETLKFARQHVS
jgi:hypothetical protein